MTAAPITAPQIPGFKLEGNFTDLMSCAPVSAPRGPFPRDQRCRCPLQYVRPRMERADAVPPTSEESTIAALTKVGPDLDAGPGAVRSPGSGAPRWAQKRRVTEFSVMQLRQRIGVFPWGTRLVLLNQRVWCDLISSPRRASACPQHLRPPA
jgi:hypothetical protein